MSALMNANGSFRGVGLHMAQRSQRVKVGLRGFLSAYGRELEALVEGLRAFALLSGGRGGDVRAEALSAFLSLTRVFRDCVGAPLPVVVLESTRAIALLAEMRSSSGTRAGVLALLEMAKAVSRGAMLAAQAGRVLTDAQTRLARKESPRCTCGVGCVPGAEKLEARAGTRSGRTILAPKNGPGVDALDALFEVGYERRRAASFVAFAKGPADCPACRPRGPGEESEESAVVTRDARPEEMVAEVLHVARPLMQLVLLRLFGWRSWRAWLGSLAMDVASGALMKRPENEGEQDEKRRRQMMMLLYLVRSPVFDFLMRFLVRRLESVLRRIPIIGGPVSASVELLVMLQRFWFYTAGS